MILIEKHKFDHQNGGKRFGRGDRGRRIGSIRRQAPTHASRNPVPIPWAADAGSGNVWNTHQVALRFRLERVSKPTEQRNSQRKMLLTTRFWFQIFVDIFLMNWLFARKSENYFVQNSRVASIGAGAPLWCINNRIDNSIIIIIEFWQNRLSTKD